MLKNFVLILFVILILNAFLGLLIPFQENACFNKLKLEYDLTDNVEGIIEEVVAATVDLNSSDQAKLCKSSLISVSAFHKFAEKFFPVIK